MVSRHCENIPVLDERMGANLGLCLIFSRNMDYICRRSSTYEQDKFQAAIQKSNLIVRKSKLGLIMGCFAGVMHGPLLAYVADNK